jgi:drug/metabolite transporter (DMT)-like permease
LRAVLYAIGGFTLWVSSDTFIKLIRQFPVPFYELMAVSSVGGMAVILAFAWLNGSTAKLKVRKWTGLLVLGALHLLNFTCWIMAIAHLPLANLYTVSFLSPMMVAILAAIFLREHISWKHGLAIVAGFVGVTIAINPEHLMRDSKDWSSYGFVFASMNIISVQMLLLRILGSRESRESVSFYPRIVIFAGSLIAVVGFGFVPISLTVASFAFVSGCLGSLGWLFMAQAYKLAPAASVAPFHYSQILSGALVGYLIWHDVPSAHVLTGAAIIIVSGIYIITHSRKSAQLLKEESHS